MVLGARRVGSGVGGGGLGWVCFGGGSSGAGGEETMEVRRVRWWDGWEEGDEGIGGVGKRKRRGAGAARRVGNLGQEKGTLC